MQIAHIITRFISGGADENTLSTCNHQAERGHDVTLACGRDWSAVMRSNLHPRVDFISFPSLIWRISPWHDGRAVAELRAYLRERKPDIVHTHTSKAGFVGRVAARLAGVPTVVHGVHILPFVNAPPLAAPFYVLAERACGTLTDLFVHVGPHMRDECAARNIGRNARHIVAESGMDVARFRNAPPPADQDDLLASPVDSIARPFVVLSLAVLEPRKGLRKFLPVFCRLVAHRPNTVLLVAGEGGERAALRDLAAALGLQRHVRFLGFRRDPERLLAIADALVICSEREGLPRVAVQAAIAGVPIVTTDLPGMGVIVRERETGFVVPHDNFERMRLALRELIDNPQLRAQMREALSRIDYSPWSAERMTSRIEAAYAAVVRGSGTGPQSVAS